MSVLLLLAVCASGHPVVIERGPEREPPRPEILPLVDKLQNNFWTEYGEGWRDVTANLNLANFKRAIDHLEATGDRKGARGARFMFFPLKVEGKLTELFLLNENAAGEVVLSFTSGNTVVHEKLTKVIFKDRLTFKYGEGRKKGAFRFPADDREYYREIFDFYQHVLLCPEHGFTRSDFLAWSVKHSYGVPREKFELLGRLITDPVEATLTDRNMDFLCHWMCSAKLSDKTRLREILGLLARIHPASILAFLRGCMLLKGLGSDANSYIREDAGVGQLIPELVMGDGDLLTQIVDGMIANPDLLHAEGFLSSDEIRHKFHGSRWWRVTAMVCARMASAMAAEPKFRQPEWPEVIWPRIAFLTVLGLRTVCSMIAVKQGIGASAPLLKELNMLSNVTKASWFFDTPPPIPRSTRWIHDIGGPLLTDPRGSRRYVSDQWTREGGWDSHLVVLRFLVDMCCNKAMDEEWRIRGIYNGLFSGRSLKWDEFNPQEWAFVGGNRQLAERSLMFFLYHRAQPVGVTIRRPTAGVCPRYVRVKGPDGKFVLVEENPEPPAPDNLEDDLLNALKILSKDLRHSRRHNRYHRRW